MKLGVLGDGGRVDVGVALGQSGAPPPQGHGQHDDAQRVHVPGGGVVLGLGLRGDVASWDETAPW